MSRRLTIHTTHVYPPIPTRNMDWSATTDNYEPGSGPNSLIGHGPTEADAVYDLFIQIESLEADDQDRFDYETRA